MNKIAAVVMVAGGALLGGLTSAFILVAIQNQNVQAAPLDRERTEPHTDPPAQEERRRATARPYHATHHQPEDAGDEPDDENEKTRSSEKVVEEISEEEAILQLRERNAERFAAHERDWRDPEWAPAAEESLEQSFATVEGSHEILGIECKTTSCVVEVKWPDDPGASAGYKKLLHQPTEPNCSSSFLLEPSPDGGPSSQRLYLDCVDARAQ